MPPGEASDTQARRAEPLTPGATEPPRPCPFPRGARARLTHVQGVLALHEGALAQAAEHFRESASLVSARAPAGRRRR
ncbi:hypothetical protein [Streptomyces thermolilacinus]|uniref:Uncharacterized protein n=1 Tax=Streptomyces thermolilacinus SPC6 TaxID=1306406 RepID=A0A1D3DLZ9_9ACTN|nr:hypothetical protein [Streptomyces thermolilacinus]OEJ93348.1 hypothetical protein J116_001545 [Streptomyces thermolilacinus SPC6]